jgi:hypothetical protein
MKAGALLYHLRRRAIVYHVSKRTTPHTNNAREQRTQQHTTPLQPGRRVNRSHRKLCRCHQRSVTPQAATRCKLQQPPELLHLELSPTSRSHMIVDPSASTLLRRNTPIKVPIKTTDPGHSVWGPRLIHHLTLLSAKTRIPETALTVAPPPSRNRDHHCTKRANSRLHTQGPSAPPYQHGPSAPPQLQRTRQHH